MSENPGSAPAGNPTAPAAGDTPPAAPAAPATNERWYGGAAEDLRGFAELKGWDTAEKAIASYRDLEKHMGVPAEQLLKLPKDAADVDGWNAVKQRLGFAPPAKAEDYDIAVPEGQSDAFAKAMRELFHKNGVPADMAKALVDGNNAYWAEQAKADEAAMETANANAMTALKTEWGANFDKLSQMADRARAELAPKMGLNEDMLGLLTDVLGPAVTLKMFAGLGESIGEAKYRTGESTTVGPLTPEGALAKREMLINDQDWQRRYQAGDVRARQEWDQVNQTLAHAAASSGQVR